MPCASCKDHSERRMNVTVNSVNKYPLSSNDLMILAGGEIRKFTESDWPDDKDKLLVFVPASFTPVCEDEAGHMQKWYEEFKKLGCEMILCLTDPATMIKDWFESEDLLRDPPYKTFSSYLLPNRLNVIDNGRPKRVSVFITKEGEIVKMESFDKVGRNFSELHRSYWAYTQNNYCGSGWENPESGFLKAE